MVRDSETYAEKDKERKELIEARNEADTLAYSVDKSLNEYKVRNLTSVLWWQYVLVLVGGCLPSAAGGGDSTLLMPLCMESSCIEFWTRAAVLLQWEGTGGVMQLTYQGQSGKWEHRGLDASTQKRSGVMNDGKHRSCFCLSEEIAEWPKDSWLCACCAYLVSACPHWGC